MTRPALDLALVDAEPDRWRRVLLVIALLDEAMGEREPHRRPTVVGGSAVEFWSTGGYASRDIDVVVFDRDAAAAVLKRSGFEQIGHHWVHAASDLWIEFPGTVLTYGPDAYQRIADVSISGHQVQVISVEDLIIDRLCSGRDADLSWARELVALHQKSIRPQELRDLGTLNGVAVLAQVELLLAETQRLLAETQAGP